MPPSAAGPVRVSLRQLFPEAEFRGGDDVVVSRCSADSRRVAAGQLFVAIVGNRSDGHDHLSEALQRGATAVLVSRPCEEISCPQCVVPDTRSAWARLSQALAGHPAKDLSLVGITGTNGKTTTSLLVRQILTIAGHQTGLIGTLEYHDGVHGTLAQLTTPDPPVLAYWFSSMRERGTTHAVMEVSSHSLCQRRLDGLELDVAVVTNVTSDHLDYHGTPSGYVRSKRRIFEYLRPSGTAVINLDDPLSSSFADGQSGRVLRVGIEAEADISARLLAQSLEGQRFLLQIDTEQAEVHTPLIGVHNVSNCLAAAAACRHYGVGLPQIVAGIESLRRIPGRLEAIDCGTEFKVYVDYAHTEDALKRALATLRPLVPGRLICVFGAGGDRDCHKRPRMARAVETGADVAVVTSDNPRTEDPQRIIADILAGFRDRAMAHVELDRRQAIRLAFALAARGDCVLIAGKGHETYQLIGSTRIEFDDRRVAQQEAEALRSAELAHPVPHRPVVGRVRDQEAVAVPSPETHA